MADTVYSTLSSISRRRLLLAVFLVTCVIGIGTLGFKYTEGFGWVDSLYASVQTVTTVGYGDVHPRTSIGRVFAVFLMLSGVGLVLYALTVMAQAVLQSEVVEAMEAKRRLRDMKELKDHYIVCGAGRVGRRIIRSLQREGIPHVVIERNEDRLANLEHPSAHFIIGDATLEDTLRNAGVKRAKGLASCLPDDPANVYVVLTARGLNKSLHIVARAVEEQAEPTLIRAGASRVVAPTIIGSQSMARSLLKPAIADFMESIVAESMDLVFEEVAVDENSQLVNRRLEEASVMRELNLIVVAIRKKEGEIAFQPSAQTLIEEGDLLIVIGNAESVKKLVEASR